MVITEVVYTEHNVWNECSQQYYQALVDDKRQGHQQHERQVLFVVMGDVSEPGFEVERRLLVGFTRRRVSLHHQEPNPGLFIKFSDKTPASGEEQQVILSAVRAYVENWSHVAAMITGKAELMARKIIGLCM
jgi:hypothetical protein